MKKKTRSAIIAAILAGSILAGCGSTSSQDAVQETTQADTSAQEAETVQTAAADTQATEQETAQETKGWDGETSHIIVSYLTLGTTPADLQMVQDRLNERTIPEIGVEVELKPISAYDSVSQFPTQLATGERWDLIFPVMEDINSLIDQGLIDPMTQLIKDNAPYIQSLTDEGYTFASNNTVDGEIWAVAQIPNVNGASGAYIFKTQYLDEIGFEADSDRVYTLDDLTDLFAQIKDKHPDLYPCGLVTSDGSQYGYIGCFDRLGGGSSDPAVFMGTDSDTVVDLYESEEYQNYIRHCREWEEAGYIHPDAATTDQTVTSLLDSGVTAGYFMTGTPTMQRDDLTIVQLTEPFERTQTMGGWVVPVTAQEPEAAVRFLNLMYEDSDIANLIQWGIEGTHYVMKDADANPPVIAFPEGVDATTSGYYNSLGLYGDVRRIYVWNEGSSQEDNDAFSEKAMQNPSKAIGFIYKPSDDARTKQTAIAAVISQYTPALESGSVDVDQYYASFISDLKAAGIDDIIAEKQEQFDAAEH